MKKSLAIIGFIGLFLAPVATARASQQLFHATLNGSQQANASTGRGDGTVLLDDVANTITVNLSFTGLIGGPAFDGHIHGAANPGTSAAVIFTLAGVPHATSGSIPQQVFAVTAGQITDFRAGRFYMDIHNAPLLGAEIRGQLLAAPNRAWTAVGSSGTADEDSQAIFQIKNFTILHQPGATGTVNVRYNITSLGGVSSFCPASFSGVAVRFRNSDASGATARVTFTIHASNVTAGGNTTLFTFDSNTAGAPSDTSFHSVFLPAPNLDFDFSTNIYWIEAAIFRSNPSQFADLGSLQIWESTGTSCP